MERGRDQPPIVIVDIWFCWQISGQGTPKAVSKNPTMPTFSFISFYLLTVGNQQLVYIIGSIALR